MIKSKPKEMVVVVCNVCVCVSMCVSQKCECVSKCVCP